MSVGRVRFAITLALVTWLAPASALAQAVPIPAPPPERPATERRDDVQPPAKAADPPLLPPSSAGGPPTSTSGTDVAPSEPGAAPAIDLSDKEGEAKQDRRIRGLEYRITRDEQRIRSLEDRLRVLRNLRLEAFVQPQLLVQTFNSAASPNLQPNGELPAGIGANDTIAKADDTTTNGTFFRVRRARMRTFYETDVMRLFLQIDALPAGGVGPGIGTILRNAEATGIARWTRQVRTEFTAGLFFTPFRKELLEASLYRPFIERTWFVQNAFPVERNYGAHAKTIALDDRLVIDVSVVNGQTLGEKTFVALPDLNRSKDLIGHLTYKVGFVTLGMSGYFGRGQVVDPQALRFKQFSKWAVNYEATAEYRLLRSLGETRLSAELTVAQNLDTGVIYSFAAPRIPSIFADNVQNLDERALYVRFEQDIKTRLTAGYRYDMYSPNTAIKNNARDTHAFLLVAKISPNLRWMNELGWAIDNVHPAGAAPPSKHIVMFSSVLQAMF
jgi:hypothetical protein